MKLSIIDRIIIVRSLLPETGNLEQIKLMISIKQKIGFTSDEMDSFGIFEPYKGILEIPNATLEMTERTVDFDITIQELQLLKIFAENCNVNGWITESSLSTIEYILNYTLE